MDPACRLCADSLDLPEVKDGCGADVLDVAEEGEERLPTGLADAGDPVQEGLQVLLLLHLPVVRYGKSVRLVPDPLEEKKDCGPPREVDRVLAAGQVDAVFALIGCWPAAVGRGKEVALPVCRRGQCIDRRAFLRSLR